MSHEDLIKIIEESPFFKDLFEKIANLEKKNAELEEKIEKVRKSIPPRCPHTILYK